MLGSVVLLSHSSTELRDWVLRELAFLAFWDSRCFDNSLSQFLLFISRPATKKGILMEARDTVVENPDDYLSAGLLYHAFLHGEGKQASPSLSP